MTSNNTEIVVIAVVVLLLALALPGVLIWCFLRSMRIKRLVPRLLLTAVSLAALGLYGRAVYAVAPLGDKHVARTTGPRGTEMVLFQRCNYSPEPYHTLFYYREPNMAWKSFQIDFEDTRWVSGRIEIDPNADLTTVYRGKDQVARFDLKTQAFTMGDWTQTQTDAYVYPDTLTIPWKK